MTRHISAHRTTNAKTGVRRYFHDGKRVSYESYAFAAIRADRISCFVTDRRGDVTRDHSLLTIERAA